MLEWAKEEEDVVLLLSMESREGEMGRGIGVMRTRGSQRGRQRRILMPQLVTTEAHIAKEEKG